MMKIKFKSFFVLFCLLFIFIFLIKILILASVKYNKPEILNDKKILIVYYSHAGNTKNIASNLHKIVGGDLKEIKLLEEYPSGMFKMTKLVNKQIKDKYFPKIEDIDISDYDIIFIGSPIWHFSVSLPASSFLRNNNFDNKIVIPFISYSGGARKGKVKTRIQELVNTNSTNVKVLPPLFIFENGIFLIDKQIEKWLNDLK